jgi:hypothetical protein
MPAGCPAAIVATTHFLEGPEPPVDEYFHLYGPRMLARRSLQGVEAASQGLTPWRSHRFSSCGRACMGSADESHKTMPNGERRGSGARLEPELGQDVQHMVLDGALANRKDVGNGAIGAAVGEQPQYLQLAWAQPI